VIKEGIAMTMEGEIHLNPKLVVERIQDAVNNHDVEAFIECLDPFYHGEEPAHPERAFRGREKIRSQWSAIFKRVPKFKSEIVRSIADRDAIWTEWYWHGMQTNGKKLEMRGVTIFGLREDRVLWSRIYVEPVEVGGAGIEAAAE
jgi:predicted SnoaL-like aldol condensation-catalyzing enzyme